MASKQRIQQDAEATQKRMDAANRLINGLAGEKRRWTAQSDAFADEIKRLTVRARVRVRVRGLGLGSGLGLGLKLGLRRGG